MAVLRSLQGTVPTPLLARTLIGRSEACTLRLDARHVSGEHATITWTGRQWEIRDLGSRNGTYVDGTRIDAGTSAPIAAGARLAFGDADESWVLAEDDPPTVMAVHVDTGVVRAGQDDLLVLPNNEQPEISLYADASGWWLDAGDGRPTPVDDRAIVPTTQGSWRVELPGVAEGTPLMTRQLSVETVHLRLDVSRDEERVRITLVDRGVDIPLPPREHGYVLLTLARARQQDAALPPAERGWRDRDALARMLALDTNALNVAIHRVRQQLSAAGVQGAVRIVEVRRGQRRMGTDRFAIGTLEEK